MTKTIKVGWQKFEDVVMKVLDELDTDAFARIGGEVLGGECFYDDSTEEYLFTPNENYCDAFGEAEEE